MCNDEKPFRPNAGIIVFNKNCQVLAGERLDTPGHWQLPQGGIDMGESPEKAAIRELYEEIGLKMPKPDLELSDWLEYIFPADISEGLRGYCGQRQKWFLYHWEGEPSTLDLCTHEQEFGNVEWKTLSFLRSQIVDFKRAVYQELENQAIPLMKSFLNQGIQTGIE